jgi:hypothetical protein
MGIGFVGCSGSQPSNPQNLTLQLQLGQYATAKVTHPILELLTPKLAEASVDSLTMCFKRVRLKTQEDIDSTLASSKTGTQSFTETEPENESEPAHEVGEDGNIDFAIGEVNVSASGAALGNISVPAGHYRRIEFDLDSSCASGKSIQLANSNGSFSSTDSITIRFEGDFVADSSGVLILGVQNILDSLNSFAGGDLKAAAENISGELSE